MPPPCQCRTTLRWREGRSGPCFAGGNQRRRISRCRKLDPRRVSLRLLLLEVAVEVAERVTVDLLTAKRFAKQRHRRKALWDEFVLIDQRNRLADFPLGLLLLFGVEEEVGDYERNRGDVGSHTKQ